ncbi:glycerate kinase [Caloranaerobacter ferrireducens]|uniref:glycerate kinase n=1 Tax=Caloranaerobacter ferrireducens TaxID=1323370 RepID=UPI00084E0504|nr:glycerate kinase [Caloranaerobacter ferrireducens]
MKILVAPDSFKGSLTALEVAECMEKGILKVLPNAQVIKVPMADGGEGTVRALVDANKGEIIYKKVTGPLGTPVNAFFGVLGDGKRAVIEMAAASGLPLVPKDKANPMITTTYGTGELIKHALDFGVEELIIGIGGSATNDAGVGMAQALGIRFLDENGEEIGFGGKELIRIKEIDISGLDKRILKTRIKVACDVTNPLYGPNGAAFVYAPQKGADEEMVKLLDRNLKHFAEVVKNQLGIDVQNIPGAGAAGGLGAGIVAFLGGKLLPGIKIVLEANNFTEKLNGVKLVITGEGRIDGQTVNGKTPIGVAKEAKKMGIPVIAIAGTLGHDSNLVLNEGIDAVFSIIQKPTTLEKAIEYTSEWIKNTTSQIVKVFIL